MALERGQRLLLGTSGTSAASRSVLRTAASWSVSFPHVTALTGMAGTSRVWVPGPLSSTMNLFAAVHARHVGATLVDAPERATHAVLTPAALARLLPSLPAGIHLVVAGDRLTAGLHDRAVAAGLRVSHYYGAAELSFVAWGPHADALSPFPGVEVASREGVLWVRSPYVCQGYVGGAGPLRVDDSGFASVGDRGVLADGRVVVHGRGTEAVTTGGATVLVADVEAALRPFTVGEVVVVGLPHPDLGQVLAAVLTSESGLADVRVAARSLPDTHRPRRWFHVPALPTTPAGKVDRPALVALLTSGHEGPGRLVCAAP
ncbi:MAG TPA: o-succinylbenzoate--CoA ligase [Nocardioidaceae bacterium]|nr:o-succinylbenzoate--CoA ligase [Nocardioidaceae bacterium]